VVEARLISILLGCTIAKEIRSRVEKLPVQC